jgi:transcriptional regulator with XRE-family HTH domain
MSYLKCQGLYIIGLEFHKIFMQTWAQFLLKKIAELEQETGRRISNKEFGEMLGYSSGTMSLWLNGKNTPSIDSVPKLAEKLGTKSPAR